MKELKCVFRAHYKLANSRGSSCWELGQFEIWLPEREAYLLQNDKAGRLRVFMMHMPTAAVVLNENVVLEVHTR